MSITIGLADWYTFTHTDKRTTSLRQNETHLAPVIDRTLVGSNVAWFFYDQNGMVQQSTGEVETFGQACELVDGLMAGGV